MEIKAAMSSKPSPPPSFTFKPSGQDCWKAHFSQSDSAIRDWSYGSGSRRLNGQPKQQKAGDPLLRKANCRRRVD